MKNLIKFLLIILLAVYIGYVFISMSATYSPEVCRSVSVVIADSTRAGFITQDVVRQALSKSRHNPVGQLMDEVDSRAVEEMLEMNSFIDDAVCYKMPGGRLNIIVVQRLPLLRVIADNGENYYLDSKGVAMNPQGYSADLVVATGHISKSFAGRQLTKLGLFLRDNSFWDEQVEQIHVNADGSVDLIPRVGCQVIHIGQVTGLEKKFRNLMALYQKVMPAVGWNKYSRINVEHENQIICTKA